MTLTGKQKRFLRGRGHALAATVQVGKEGVSEAVVDAVDRALLDHELVKVRIGRSALVDRHSAAIELATRTASEVAQVLGSTMLLFRAHPEEPRLKLPAERATLKH